MSKYTTELRYYLEWLVNFDSGNDIDSVIEKAEPIFFEKIVYPIYSEEYRHVLNKKILAHFYFREIGFETVALFHNRFKTKMFEIMPGYSELLKESALSLYDNLVLHNHSKTASVSTNSQESESESKNKNRRSDTPQGGLKGLENDEYISEAYLNDDKTNSRNEATLLSKGNGCSNQRGITGESMYHLLKENGTLMTVELAILKELDSLFMMTY